MRKTTLTKIYDSIVVSSCLFGSLYVYSNSFKLINEKFSESKNLVMLNTINCVISGSIFIYGIFHFKDVTN
jgi:hypothetical protein